jgi:hypothetical protein
MPRAFVVGRVMEVDGHETERGPRADRELDTHRRPAQAKVQAVTLRGRHELQGARQAVADERRVAVLGAPRPAASGGIGRGSGRAEQAVLLKWVDHLL